MTPETADRVHLAIRDAAAARWEIPAAVVPRPLPPAAAPQSAHYIVHNAANKESFTLEIERSAAARGVAAKPKSASDVLLSITRPANASFDALVYQDQYIELSAVVGSDARLVGCGESSRPEALVMVPGTTYTLWNRDEAAETPDVNLYGSHPFILVLQPDGSASGLFMRNSNGMDIVYSDDGAAVTFRMIGGIVDLYVFAGPTPKDVVAQYTELVGRPHMPPLWSLGFHQSKWGYKDLATLKDVVAAFKQANLPLDTIWSDIDHMDKFYDFTFDPVNYPVDQMKTFVDTLHADGQQYVTIVDPGIATDPSYSVYADGVKNGVFVRDEVNGYFRGKVWPGDVYFPDWFGRNTTAWWTAQIRAFLDKVPIDGLWTDMNEASNFCDGECPEPSRRGRTRTRIAVDGGTHVRTSSRAVGDNQWDNPPYNINNCGTQCPLNHRTLDMDALHYPHTKTDPASSTLEYNVHNLYGLMEGIATKTALEQIRGKRSFVLTRSSFASSGAHVAHWTGDNESKWTDLGFSVHKAIRFGLFGVSQIGCDLCGFNGNTTEELCARWMEVGAFFPFARNHASDKSIAQEPYRWPSVANATRDAMTVRYRIMPYLYTLMAEASATGVPPVRALWMEFPAVAETHAIDAQFMLGDALLVSPVLIAAATNVVAYVPPGVWYDWYTLEALPRAGVFLELDAPLQFINVHVRGGSIVATQDYTPPATVTQNRNNPFRLVVAPDTSAAAAGTLYFDDGDSLDAPYVVFAYTLQVSAETSSWTLAGSQQSASGTVSGMPKIEAFSIAGVSTRPTNVTLNGSAVTSFSFDTVTHVLDIGPLASPTAHDFQLTIDMA